MDAGTIRLLDFIKRKKYVKQLNDSQAKKEKHQITSLKPANIIYKVGIQDFWDL